MSLPLVIRHALVLLCCCTLLTACQSIGAYEPLCRADDDCASHQRCDAYLGACTLRLDYPACEPDEALDRCPVATQCDAEARTCLPRPFRIAWFHDFDSPQYLNRQTANYLKYTATLLAKNHFGDALCDPNDAAPCPANNVELVFVSLDGPLTGPEAVAPFYQDTPFDVGVALDFSTHEALRAFSQEEHLDLLSFSFANFSEAAVRRELAPGYTPPPLDQRFDFSIAPLLRDDINVAARMLTQALDCERPVLITRLQEISQIFTSLTEEIWPQHGICPHVYTLPGAPQPSYRDTFIATLDAEGYDCVYFYSVKPEIYEILNDYNATREPDAPRVKWLYNRRSIDTLDTRSQLLRDLVTREFSQTTTLLRTLVDSQRFVSFYTQEFSPATPRSSSDSAARTCPQAASCSTPPTPRTSSSTPPSPPI